MAPPRRSNPVAAALVLLVLAGLLAGLVTLVTRILTPQAEVYRPAEQCVASVGDVTTSITREQAGNVAIITAAALQRGLVPRAASIGIVTAWQESGLRNLDYGDRDSIGLFQQRPSQGWGTVEQIMDPWYSAGRFYQALVQVPGWETGDINDVAQTVQRSGFPEAYRQHEPNGRAWASALTGHSPRAVTCLDRSGAAANTAPLVDLLSRAYGSAITINPVEGGLSIATGDEVRAWSVAQLAMVVPDTGLTKVRVNDWSWANDPDALAPWQQTAPGEPNVVLLTFRG